MHVACVLGFPFLFFVYTFVYLSHVLLFSVHALLLFFLCPLCASAFSQLLVSSFPFHRVMFSTLVNTLHSAGFWAFVLPTGRAGRRTHGWTVLPTIRCLKAVVTSLSACE